MSTLFWNYANRLQKKFQSFSQVIGKITVTGIKHEHVYENLQKFIP